MPSPNRFAVLSIAIACGAVWALPLPVRAESPRVRDSISALAAGSDGKSESPELSQVRPDRRLNIGANNIQTPSSVPEKSENAGSGSGRPLSRFAEVQESLRENSPRAERPSPRRDSGEPILLAPSRDGQNRDVANLDPPTKTGWKGAATVASSLALVLGLFFIVAWVMRRNTTGPSMLLPSTVLEVLGRAPLASRQQIHLIRLGNKLILVSATPAGVEPLGEVTEADEVQRLVALCRQASPNSATAAFRQVFAQFGVESERNFEGAGDRSGARRGLASSRSVYSDDPREGRDG